MTKIVIAHEYPIVVWSLRKLLEKQLGLTVVGEANNTKDWIKLVEHMNPDALIVSTPLIDDRSVITACKLREYARTTRIFALSAQQVAEMSSARFAGVVRGWISEAEPPEVMLLKMQHLISGQAALHMGKPLQSKSRLTNRELQVLRLAANGKSVLDIAAQLAISPRTVEVHKSRMRRKLGLRTQVDLVRYALNHGFLSMDQDSFA